MGHRLERLRETSREAIRELAEADVVVVFDTGPRGIHRRARADLTGIGAPQVQVELPVPSSLTAAATRVTQYPLVAADRLPLSAGVLVALVADVVGEVPVIVVTVPERTEGPHLTHAGAGLVEAVRSTDVTGVVVSSGDLSAALDEASPRYVVPGAEEWDRELIDSVEQQDVETLYALGPARAREVHARSWPALAAFQGATAAARLRPVTASYHTPLGVGQLVARFEPDQAPEPGQRFRR